MKMLSIKTELTPGSWTKPEGQMAKYTKRRKLDAVKAYESGAGDTASAEDARVLCAIAAGPTDAAATARRCYAEREHAHRTNSKDERASPRVSTCYFFYRSLLCPICAKCFMELERLAPELENAV